jgi:hypothetical protein
MRNDQQRPLLCRNHRPGFMIQSPSHLWLRDEPHFKRGVNMELGGQARGSGEVDRAGRSDVKLGGEAAADTGPKGFELGKKDEKLLEAVP